ncbi:acyltransferase family protein [Kineococcus indalonis]|uniref:acyltransferase family protein n=1 Tax=Kineococcus indalonis TaxID=2696566 RepID=UPI0014133FB3|nr:acyltransferase family protein [Kineococcus indalonis]NAZ86910.1 acyltransferase family protein [Kineococcus indalonis]
MSAPALAPPTGATRPAAPAARREVPGGRDRTVDALRVGSLAAVVAGHWLVTGLAVRPDGLAAVSPLPVLPGLAPLTWVLQTLGPLFLAAGFAAARRGRGGAPARRGAPAAPVVLAALAVVLAALVATAPAAVPGPRTAPTVVALALSPLWFLAVLAALSLLRPALQRLLARSALWLLAPAAAVVLLDAVGGGTGWAATPVAVAVQALLCWSVPFGLGLRHADAPLPPRAGAALAAAGAVALAVLLGVARHPSSAVGVPGAARSNLAPPSAAALALAAAQVGTFLLLRPVLQRLLRGARTGRVLAAVNRRCLPVYLLHQPVLLACAVLSAAVPQVPGPLGAPGSAGAAAGWLAQRPAALVLPDVLVLALALATGGGRSDRRSRVRQAPGASSPGASSSSAANQSA